MRAPSPTTLPAPVLSTEGSDRGEPAVHWIFPSIEGQVTLLPPGAITLGRDPDNNVELAGLQTSRRHASIERRGAALSVRDLKSRNGIFVNGTRMPESPLCVGDLLRIGGWLGVVRMVAPAQVPAVGFREVIPSYFVGSVLGSVLEPVERVATTDLPVVVQGETGTGKEGVAQALHRWSRRSGALVAINCGALPEHLAEGELFGYRKGAFTGADRANPGHLRAADQGTLFLDEIADLPLAIQIKLLRALEQREVVPLGESHPVPVDVRIVAAAQSSLRQQMEQGRLRPDLYARLEGLTVVLPPLRERRIELPFLFSRMLEKQAKKSSTPTLDPATVEALCLYDWPFNLRELDRVARQLWALHGSKPSWLSEHLPERFRQSPSGDVPKSAAPAKRRPIGRKDVGLDDLRVALRSTQGNVSHAVELLGISRAKAYRLMETGEREPKGGSKAADRPESDRSR
jgi:transcriptional regulator with AAA-type ATPase domain